MKKIIDNVICLSICMFFAAFPMFSDNRAEISVNGIRRDIIFVNGFDFNNITTPIEDINITVDIANEPTDVLIGYSMGGLRAMASVPDFIAADTADTLYGIITLDSPLKGFRGLQIGWPALHEDLEDAIDILSDGIFLSISADPGLIVFLDIATNSTILHEIINLFDSDGVPSIISEIYADPIGVAYRTIIDMTPNSPFLRNYIWRESTQELPSFFSSGDCDQIDFGFIIGYEHDPEDFAISDSMTLNDIIESCKYVYTHGQIKNNILAAAYAWNPPLHIFYITAAIKCLQAYNWCNNFDANYGSLLGSSQHDMLIARSSQYLEIPTEYRIIQNIPYKYSSDVDHHEALESEIYWGEDSEGWHDDQDPSLFAGDIGVNGYIREFLNAIDYTDPNN
jgi:hypothetical protein